MRKWLSVLLCMCLTAGMLLPTGVVSAASDVQVSVFESFSGYSTPMDGGVPSGWIARSEDSKTGVGMALDEERNSRIMQIGEHGEAVLPFGDNFDRGSMHISYDVKLTGDDGDKSLMTSMYANSSDSLDHQYDYTYFENGGNQVHYMFNTGTAKNNIPVYGYNDSWRWMGRRVYSKDKYYTTDTWHKVDIYVEQTPSAASVYYVYLDGEKLDGYVYDSAKGTLDDSTTMHGFSSNNYVKNFTGLILRAYDGVTAFGQDGTAKEKNNSAYLIDNVYAQTYIGTSDALSFTVDDMSGSSVAARNGKLAVGFSEWLSEAPTANNFTVTGPSGNVSGFTVENADEMQCVLSFSDLEPGTYTVAVSGVTGAISGQVANGQETFTVTSVNDPSTTRYYLMDENFNDYTGEVYGTKSSTDNTDTPVGWEHTNRATTIDEVNAAYSKQLLKYPYFGYGERQWNSVKSSQRGDGDYALKMTRPNNQEWGSSIAYFFPAGIANGDFTLEFDIKHTNGGWGISMVNADSQESLYTQRAYTNLWSTNTGDAAKSTDEMKTNAAKLLDSRMNWTFMGMGLSGNAVSPNLGFSNKFGGGGTDFKTLNDTSGQVAQVPTNIWTHIKAEINTDTGVYEVTITPENGTAQTVEWKDDVPGRFVRGVMGLGLHNYINNANVNNEVEFDNIQVYKNNSYLLEQDFEGYTVEAADLTTAYTLPGGWWKVNDPGTVKYAPSNYVFAYNVVASTTGVTAEGISGGHAMKLYNGVSVNNILLRAFSHAVNGGVPFAIEFDAKNSDSNAGWKLHLESQADLQWLASYNQTHHLENGDTLYRNTTNWGVQGFDTILERNAAGVLRRATSARPYDTGADVTDISKSTPNEWYHYKLVVIPVAENSTKYVVYVNPVGDEVALEMGEFTNTRNCLTQPIAGIGFEKTGSPSTSPDNAYVAFDNIKVYEVTEGTSEYGATTYDAKTSYQNASATVEVEYRDGRIKTLTEGDVFSPQLAKRIAVHFSAPVALSPADEVVQPTNYSMSSTKLPGVKDQTTDAGRMDFLNASPDKIVYHIYDTADDVIALRRLYATMTDKTDDAALQGMSKYFSSDRKTYYIEFSDDAPLTDGKDYVLMINRNISFTNSTYATLDKDIRIQFAAEYPEDGEWKITDFTLQRLESEESGLWIDVRDLSELTAGTRVKLVSNGYNETKETQKIFLAYAGYKKDAATGAQEILNVLTLPQADIEPQSMYHWEQEIAIESLADLDAFKGFIWEDGTMRPLADHVEVTK